MPHTSNPASGSKLGQILTALAIFALIFGTAWWTKPTDMPDQAAANMASSQRPSSSTGGAETTSTARGGTMTDAELEEAVLGRWTVQRYGTQIADLSPDGTGEIDVRLNWAAALLYGSQMTLKIIWTIDDGVMTHQIITGTPKENVQALVNDYGDTLTYEIVKSGPSDMILRDTSDGDIHHWKRLPDSDAKAK